MFLLRCFLEKVEMPQHYYQLNDLLLDSYGCVVSVSWVSKTMSLRKVSNNDEPTISRELVVTNNDEPTISHDELTMSRDDFSEWTMK